jgi:hypothetical protein
MSGSDDKWNWGEQNRNNRGLAASVSVDQLKDFFDLQIRKKTVRGRERGWITIATSKSGRGRQAV